MPCAQNYEPNWRPAPYIRCARVPDHRLRICWRAKPFRTRDGQRVLISEEKREENMGYYQFAAGAAKYGLKEAIQCAVLFLVPIEVTLAYVRRYAREGYRV